MADRSVPGSVPLVANWPTDQNGEPLALVTMGASELIGLPSYSNVTLTGSVTRFVPNTEEGRQEGLRQCVIDVECIIAEEREPIVALRRGDPS